VSPVDTASNEARTLVLHHETIHATITIPGGAKVELGRDSNGYPSATIVVDGERVLIQFDSGVYHLGETMNAVPPTVYGMVAEKSHVTAENLTARYKTSTGSPRILGAAPAIKCSYEWFRPIPEPVLDQIFALCASLKRPSFGASRPSTPDERSHGGMTSVPEGAWVEGSLPATPGALVFRPGRFTGRMHMGELIVSGGKCPASPASLREKTMNESDVKIEERRGATIRFATDESMGHKYPGVTQVYFPRGGACCRAAFMPWIVKPSVAQVDQAIALCETFQER